MNAKFIGFWIAAALVAVPTAAPAAGASPTQIEDPGLRARAARSLARAAKYPPCARVGSAQSSSASRVALQLRCVRPDGTVVDPAFRLLPAVTATGTTFVAGGVMVAATQDKSN